MNTVDWSDPKSKITPNFTVSEATLLQKWGIYHIPNDAEKSNIIKLSTAIQKVRDAYGNPMNISNWIRSTSVIAGKLDSSGKIVSDPQSQHNKKDFNAAVKGSPTSKHKTGLAVDVRDGSRALTNLWMEDEKVAKDWVHLDLGDRSTAGRPAGRERIFKP